MNFWVRHLTEASLVLVGAGLCYLLLWWRGRSLRRVKSLEADAILANARNEAEVLLREARLAANQEALKLRDETERQFLARREELAESERRLAERESLINAQLERIMETERQVSERQHQAVAQMEELNARERRLAQEDVELRKQLEGLANIGAVEAREIVLRKVEQDAERDSNILTQRILDEARHNAEQRARRILSIAIQRYAGEHTFQNTTTSLVLQNEEIKGRIIGREGRNIRAFEAATGVTVLIDDTPGAVLLSGFDPVRREVAREAMVRLIQDGRIHPTRIEEVVSEVNKEMAETIQLRGEEAVARTGLPPMDPEIVKLLGRLHFRHSYSQNILEHSIEVAHLMGLMAAELGLDVPTAKRTGLLHDIGKAANHEVEGPHALVGAELIKRYGESETVVNGVASHHNDVPSAGPLGILVSAADAISASRPGARSENMTTYLKRVEDLEKIAAGFSGVEKAFAVQAGRELRVIVQPEKVTDEAAYGLAREIAGRIENELQYPGQIRVIVVRETRCVEVAK